jgi:mono/diheme cytochrome c family protein
MKAPILSAAAVLLVVVAGSALRAAQSTAQGTAQGAAQGTAQGTAQGKPQGTAQGKPQGTAQSTTQGTIDRYCVTCHNPRMKAGGLVLDGIPAANAASEPHTWEKVIRKVRTGMMPPAGAPRPDRATLDGLAAAVETTIDRAAAAAPNPGAPALHRLNRTEYGNAIRDLLELPIDTTALLPGDDSSEGFDNQASVLGVSPALMQSYITAAAKISRLAVGDPTTSADITTYVAPRNMSQAEHREGQPLGTRGGLLVRHIFPLDAEYEFRIGRAGGGLFGLPPVGTDDSVEVTLNGERLRVLDRNARGPLRLKIPAGPQTIGVAVVRKSNARGVDDLFSEHAASAGVTNLVINGPLNPTGPGDTPSRRRIFVCRPTAPEEVHAAGTPTASRRSSQAIAPSEDGCARTILAKLATRALRRPVNERDATITMLMGFFESGRKLRGFEAGIQYALARLLVDPQFIYRFERAPATVKAGAVYRISDLELASRLSFFLWSSIPDEELIRVAASGKLDDPAVLEQQTRRMLADDRSRALVNSLAGQWLMLRQLDDIAPVTKEFDGNLRYAFRRETELLFETIVSEDRSILDLIDADYTFVDERLARHYGIPNVRGSRFRRVTLDEGARRGLLGQGSLLTVTSAGNRTSPVKRGKWILENLLGAPVPQPPPGVETNLAAAPGAAPTSVRQRLEQHRASPTCAACHAVMDPVGFSLENFDLIGEYRDEDGGRPVNATGRLADGTMLDGPASLRKALLSRRDAVASTATEKLLTYALGRRVDYFDMPAVRTIVRDAARQDYRFSSLITGIVKSVPFTMKRAEDQ